MPATDTLSIQMRHYLSIQHLESARLFCQRCERLECQHKAEEWLQVSSRHQAFAIGTVFSAVAFLEATANEIFADALVNHLTGHLSGLSASSVERLGRLWDLGVPRTATFSILCKYDIALAATDCPPMDRSREPVQAIMLLGKLRNALIHYEPESLLIDENPDNVQEMHKLEKNLGGKFDLNQLMEGTANPFFPNKCLGHGCANWAVESSIALSGHSAEKWEQKSYSSTCSTKRQRKRCQCGRSPSCYGKNDRRTSLGRLAGDRRQMWVSQPR